MGAFKQVIEGVQDPFRKIDCKLKSRLSLSARFLPEVQFVKLPIHICRLLKRVYESPFKEFKYIEHEFQVIIQVAQKGLRPTISLKCPPSLVDLIRSCWKDNKNERPDCSTVLERLQSLQTDYEKNSKKWEQMLK